MMEHFVDELVQTFPDVPNFKKYQMVLQMARKANPRKIMTAFMDSVSPHSTKIMAKDETIWANEALTIDFLKELQINTIWTPELSNNTKDAIWQYLQTLYILGTTISMLPQDTLDMIEKVAKQCVDNMGDEKDISASLGGLVNLLGKNPPK
jgi:hypothetical protein